MVERPSRALASDGSDFENADGGRCRIAKSGGQGLPLPQLFRLYTPHQSYSVSINISNDILTNGHSNRQTHSILALPFAAVLAKRLGSLSQHNATKRVMTTHRVPAAWLLHGSILGQAVLPLPFLSRDTRTWLVLLAWQFSRSCDHPASASSGGSGDHRTWFV